MKKSTALLIASGLLICVSFTTTDTVTWSADVVHSRLGFTVNHLGIADANGNFGVFESKITSSKADFSDAIVELSGDVSSISTGNTQRDDHLKSPDFFDAAKFPKFTFKSDSFKKGTGKNYTVTGSMSFHGFTKPVTLNAVLNGTTTHPMTKKEMCGFKVTGKFKRADFAFASNMPAPMLGEEVAIIADLEFVKD